MATKKTAIQPITLTFEAPLPIAAAFAAFTALNAWWPREYTWSGEALVMIGMEPRPGGNCYEIGPNNVRLDWGHLTAFEPYIRLQFTWNIAPDRVPAPDPRHASEVEVRFFPAGEHLTRLEFAHRGFERHGEAAAAYRESLASPQGWPLILQRYREEAARRATLTK